MLTLQQRAEKIKLLICDVDGVLTDGKIYIGNEGELFKAFNVKDGLGIKMLMANGIDVAILTARSSKILDTRMKELGVTNVRQGQRDKVKGLKELLAEVQLTENQIAYIGDDLPDFAVIQRVGLAACPADANSHIQKVCHFKSGFKGGDGAVRDLAELILTAQNRMNWTIENMFLNPDPNAKHRY